MTLTARRTLSAPRSDEAATWRDSGSDGSERPGDDRPQHGQRVREEETPRSIALAREEPLSSSVLRRLRETAGRGARRQALLVTALLLSLALLL